MLSEQLKKIRKANRYTQQQISDILNIERSTYASYETGRNRPDVALLQNFSKIFKVSVDYILNINPNEELAVYDESVSYKKKSNGLLVSELSKEEREIIGLFRLCDEQGKEKIKKCLDETKDTTLVK